MHALTSICICSFDPALALVLQASFHHDDEHPSNADLDIPSLCARRLWLRPRSRKESCSKSGANPKWDAEEGSWAMPVHVRMHQVLTCALLDKDAKGSDEIGRCAL